MAQRYTEIKSTTKIRDSLQLILNNDKTSLSCSSGTSFPTANLIEGMLCFRTDEQKLYLLLDPSDSNSWKMIADLEGEFRHLDGGTGNAINYDAKDLNLWNKMPTGFYEGTNMTNAPEGDNRWRVIQIRHGNSDGFATQLAFSFTDGTMMTRTQAGGDWTPWAKVFAGSPNGEVIEGLNAEKIDGRLSGNDTNQIPISNGTVNTNLNADMVDGHHAGNGSNQVPINNSTLNSNLNADLLDGFHAGNDKGQIPVSNGSVNKNLNAEMVGGLKATDLVAKAGDGVVNLLQANTTQARKVVATDVDGLQCNIAISPRQTTTRDHRLTLGSGATSGSYDVYNNAGGSGDYSGTRFAMTVNTVPELGGAGNYSVTTILKALARVAHSHQIIKEDYRYNCKCDCNCDCNCGDDGMP